MPINTEWRVFWRWTGWVTMRRKEDLSDIVNDMTYVEAVVKVNTAVAAQVTNIA